MFISIPTQKFGDEAPRSPRATIKDWDFSMIPSLRWSRMPRKSRFSHGYPMDFAMKVGGSWYINKGPSGQVQLDSEGNLSSWNVQQELTIYFADLRIKSGCSKLLKCTMIFDGQKSIIGCVATRASTEKSWTFEVWSIWGSYWNDSGGTCWEDVQFPWVKKSSMSIAFNHSLRICWWILQAPNSARLACIPRREFPQHVQGWFFIWGENSK